MFDAFQKAYEHDKKCIREGWFESDENGSYMIKSVENQRAVKQVKQSLVVYAGKARGGIADQKPVWVIDSEAEMVQGWENSLAAYQTKKASVRSARVQPKSAKGSWSYAVSDST